LVSWNTVIHFLPASFHFLASPLIWSKVCTSPCPWGLVSRSSFPFYRLKWASLSINAGTFYWHSRVTCCLFNPK
jgi:hypothetical protein